MRPFPKTGALDRQARFPRVALRFSTTRNPASISYNYPTRIEPNLAIVFEVQNRNAASLIFVLLYCSCELNLRGTFRLYKSASSYG